MYKKLVLLILVLVLMLSGTVIYKWFGEKDLPYGYLSPASEECRKPELFSNQELCIKSGCIWGNGDLTGPNFCGASKE